jgi:hypothetical protein
MVTAGVVVAVPNPGILAALAVNSFWKSDGPVLFVLTVLLVLLMLFVLLVLCESVVAVVFGLTGIMRRLLKECIRASELVT